MADGYARVTNKPQCVIIHVDVGTSGEDRLSASLSETLADHNRRFLGLGAAVHNASAGKAPVLIFAGLSPYTVEVEAGID